MKTLKFLAAAAAAALAAPLVVHAEEAPDTAITVIATGLRQPLDRTGQSIAVIGADEIASVQGPDLTRVLQRLPGVTITRNGGLGAFTGVRVRGAESEQTLVLVDGARVADVSSPGSGFDFGTLLSGNVEKLELLRGSNSIVWGSDAIGGVVAVTTRQLEGVTASAEYGAFGTFSSSAAAGFRSGPLALTLNGGHARSDGFSQLAADKEADGLSQWQGGARAVLDLAPGLSAFADARYARSKVGLDFTFANDYVQTTRQISGRTGLAYAGPALDITAAWSIADLARTYDSPGFGYGYNGQDQTLDLKGRWRFAGNLALVFGAARQRDSYDGTFDAPQKASQTSAHALLDYAAGPFSLAAGLRLDHHDRFGDAWTTGANASFALGQGWRLRASWGEGFKAPTLYQLYSFSGNAALRPERSRSYDAAIEHGDRNGPLHFAATVFRRDARNLIDYDASANGGFGGYFNRSRTRATGFELEADVSPAETLELRAVYSYVESINRAIGRDLARRPRHALSTSADWALPVSGPLAGFALGADLRLVGDSFDDAAGRVPLDGYAVADLRASLPVGQNIELTARIENVTDQNYQTVAGYNTPGRSAFAGARMQF